MRCAKCGKINGESMKFCTSCGCELPRTTLTAPGRMKVPKAPSPIVPSPVRGNEAVGWSDAFFFEEKLLLVPLMPQGIDIKQPAVMPYHPKSGNHCESAGEMKHKPPSFKNVSMAATPGSLGVIWCRDDMTLWRWEEDSRYPEQLCTSNFHFPYNPIVTLPDGRRIVTSTLLPVIRYHGVYFPCIRVYDVLTGSCLEDLTDEKHRLDKLVVSDGHKAIAAFLDGWEIRVWDTSTLELKRILKLPNRPKWHLGATALSDTGEKFVVHCPNAAPEYDVWDLAAGLPIFHFRCNGALALSPDGDRLAAMANEHIILYHLSTCRVLAAKPYPLARIKRIVFSPDSSYILLIDYDGLASIWFNCIESYWQKSIPQKGLGSKDYFAQIAAFLPQKIASAVFYPPTSAVTEKIIAVTLDGKLMIWDMFRKES